MNHRVLEGFQKVLLELEVRQLLFLQEPHGQLTERIQSEECDVGIIMATDLILTSQGALKIVSKTHTSLKCSPRMSQRFDHSRRMRFML